MKKNAVKNIYRFVSALLLVSSVLWGLGEHIGIIQVSWMHLGLGFVSVLFLALWCQLDVKGRLILVVSAMVAVGISVREESIWNSGQSVWKVVLLAFISFGIVLFGEHIEWIKLVVAGGFLCILAFDLFGDHKMSHMGVVCILLYIVIVFVEWTEGHWKKVHIANNGHFMVSILPFLVLYFVFMALMPAPEEPYDWRFAKEIFANVSEAFKQISRNWINRDREDFDFGTSGFDGDGSLLSGITDEKKTLMIIQGHAGLKTNIYLTGKVYDTFDGMVWENTNKSTTDASELDALETLYAVRCYDLEGESKYIEKTGLKIWYEDFRTEYLFAPLKTVKMYNLENVDYLARGGNYVFNQKQGYGLEYQTTFLQLNVDHPLFYDFLEKEIVDDEAVFEETQLDAVKKVKYTLEDLDNHKEEIYATYCKPVVLSEETTKWLSDVTEDAQSDVETLKAIEAALQQMTYTKTPGEMPAYVDTETEFLDYFLLESEQGYCVYYASAFVLLARAEGLPARYVEGFCVPVSGTYQVPVTSDMAHAWPEVYIEDMGWIPFEPTPGYSEIRYTPWAIQTDELGEGYGGIGEGKNIEDEVKEETQKDEGKEEITDEEKVESKQTSGNVLKVIGFTILFAIIAGFVSLSIDRMLRRRRVKRYSPADRFKAEVAVNMHILAALGYERRDNETFSELRSRAWAIMDGDEAEEKPEFMFLKYYEEYLYGQYPINAKILQTVSAERQYLLSLLKKWKPVLYIYFQFYYHIF